MNRTTEKIPTWSLGYIINGDAIALTDDEVQTIDRWMKQWQVQDVNLEFDTKKYVCFQPIRTFEDCTFSSIQDKYTKYNPNQGRL